MNITLSSTNIAIANGREKGKLRTFRLRAYTGAPISQGFGPAIVDMEGIRFKEPLVILLGHSLDQVVGHATDVRVENGELIAEGVLSGTGQHVDQIVSSAKNGFPWQASIGGAVKKTERIPRGKKWVVNNREVESPTVVVRELEIREISIVSVGADPNTDVAIAAQKPKGNAMEDVLTADPPGEPATIPELKAAYEGIPDTEKNVLAAAEAGFTVPQAKDDAREKAIAAMKTAKYRADNVARPLQTHPVPAEGASGEYLAEVMLAEVAGLGHHHPDEARERVSKIEPTLTAFARLISGGSMQGRSGIDLQAVFSNNSTPNILSNTTGKQMREAYNMRSPVYRQISSKRVVNDFKPHTPVRLVNKTGTLPVIAPGGEIRHTHLGDEAITAQAKTYAQMVGVTREDIMNDDLGALADIPREFARSTIRTVSEEVAKSIGGASDHWTADRANLLTGATSALSLDSLAAAERLFYQQKDANGLHIDIVPRVLLVPSPLAVTANVLIGSATVFEKGDTDSKFGTHNPHNGKFEVIVEPRLDQYSTTAWYLFAGPADEPATYWTLKGKETPTVELADAPFDRLGIQYRCYFDFAFHLSDWRASIKAAGA